MCSLLIIFRLCWIPLNFLVWYLTRYYWAWRYAITDSELLIVANSVYFEVFAVSVIMMLW